jgi:sec-independent protein translocase protein TatA
MAMPSGSELLLIFGVVVLLFGAKKIPELAKGVGQGIRAFKKEMKEETHPPESIETPKTISTSTATLAEISKEPNHTV